MTKENRQVKDQIDQAASDLKGIADALTDEVIDRENGSQQYVHHINGDPKNKLVIGSSRRGKSISSNMTESKSSKQESDMHNNHFFIKPGKPKSIFEDKLSALLASLPDGVTVSHNITNGSVIWFVSEKPVDFSHDEELAFLEELNQLSLEAFSQQGFPSAAMIFNHSDPLWPGVRAELAANGIDPDAEIDRLKGVVNADIERVLSALKADDENASES